MRVAAEEVVVVADFMAVAVVVVADFMAVAVAAVVDFMVVEAAEVSMEVEEPVGLRVAAPHYILVAA